MATGEITPCPACGAEEGYELVEHEHVEEEPRLKCVSCGEIVDE